MGKKGEGEERGKEEGDGDEGDGGVRGMVIGKGMKGWGDGGTRNRCMEERRRVFKKNKICNYDSHSVKTLIYVDIGTKMFHTFLFKYVKTFCSIEIPLKYCT